MTVSSPLPPFATQADSGLDPTDPPAAGFAVDAGEFSDGVVRVRLTGELDYFTAPLLILGLAPVYEQGAPTGLVRNRGTVVLELSALTFLDTAGLTALLESRADLLGQNWRVRVTQPQPQVQRLLSVAARASWLPEDLQLVDTAEANAY